jgi:sulfite reductase beta subunit-like hemoprotein
MKASVLSGVQSQPLLEQLFARILESGQVTATDSQWFLRLALNETNLSPTVMEQIQQLSTRFNMGLIKIVD